MTYVIAVAHHAGGVGKTTTALNLGYELARAGQRVLLVDLDPQGDLTGRLGIEPGRSTLAAGMLDRKPLVPVPLTWGHVRLHILSSDLETMIEIEPKLMLVQHRAEERLSKALGPLAVHYDYILLDCPPSLNPLTTNAFYAATGVLIPVQAQDKAYWQLTPLLRSIEDVQSWRENGQPAIAGFLLTMADRTDQARSVETELRSAYGAQVYQTTIPRSTVVAQDRRYQKPLGIYAADTPAAAAYAALAKELIHVP